MPHTARRDDEVHLSCLSEAFDVQLQDCLPSELVDGVPTQGHIALP